MKKTSKANSEMLFYLLSHNAQTGQAEVRMRKGKMDEEGAPAASASDWNNIERALVAPRKRRATKPTRAAGVRRLRAKKLQADRKRGRSEAGGDD